MKPLGIYLHIPFCRSKCLYCDFCSFPARTAETVERYVERLCEDLTEQAPRSRNHEVDSVYFGGGTPTLLSGSQFARVVNVLTDRYRVTADCEWTAECNPSTGSPALFRAMREMGFNRLSIGLQSIHPDELRALGRLHDFEGFRRTWEEARDAGFDNLNADVMFGIPRQTPESFRETLERVCEGNPEHLSAYALTVEEKTPLARLIPSLPMPDEEDTATMYLDMIDYLASRGLEQYEISNFSKKGYRSRHNCKYWNTEEYLGFGPAAHSDFGGVRFGNSRDLDAYLRGEAIVRETTVPSRAERENEYVMLQMRLCDGLSGNAFRARFGHGAEPFFDRLGRYIDGGFVKRTERGMAFTPKGFLVSNTVLSEVVDFSGKNAERS